MRYVVNLLSRECLKTTCECKNCPFNGIPGMCMGCNECLEHKQLAPVTHCDIIKKGDWDGFCAAAYHDAYMIAIPMGIGDVPEYFHITQEEFDTFEQWKNDQAKIMDIENRQG